jgi:transcriptional regulator with XRE-family HTH domain
MTTSEVRIQVGRRLASVRALRGLSQQELATKSGASLSAVQRSEQGRYSADALAKMAPVLETSLDYILRGLGAP